MDRVVQQLQDVGKSWSAAHETRGKRMICTLIDAEVSGQGSVFRVQEIL